jgi:hypothetical protein
MIFLGGTHVEEGWGRKERDQERERDCKSVDLTALSSIQGA